MLYTLHHSPHHCDLPALLRLLAEGDALLLLQDGVLAGVAGTAHLESLQNAPISVYALQADIEARGLSDYYSSSISRVDYAQFVDLTVLHRQQLAW